MNAYETIDNFLATLKFAEKTKRAKRKVLLELCKYIERTQDIKGEWDFRHVKKLIYKDKEFHIPVDETILLDFMQDKSHSLVDSYSTYNEYVTALVQFCRYLLKNKILTDNPALEIPKRKKKHNDMRDRHLSLNESIRLLKAAYLYDKKNRVRNFALIQILLTTAMRPKELTNATEDRIDFKHDLLYGFGKTLWRNRILIQGMEETLDALLKDSERIKVIAKLEKRYLFYSDKGTQLKTKEMNELIRAFAKKAGIDKNISTYWLRRTFATMLSNAEFCLMEIKRIFDHDTVNSTEYYVKNDSDRQVKELVNNSSVSNMFTEFIREKLELT